MHTASAAYPQQKEEKRKEEFDKKDPGDMLSCIIKEQVKEEVDKQMEEWGNVIFNLPESL